MEGMLSKALSSQYWPAISMDRIVEAGEKVKDPNARLISPEALSIHMECHNLSNRMIKTILKLKKKKKGKKIQTGSDSGNHSLKTLILCDFVLPL